MKVADFIGQYAIHYHYGKVIVNDAPKRSKAMVNITVLQRGKGWNGVTDMYEIYKLPTVLYADGSRSIRRRLTHTDEYGIKDTVHIKSLTIKT
tara:strand:+ start:3195 stop:3473 length:279 start_codon:yes stop_codon:yes gene_type:complete